MRQCRINLALFWFKILSRQLHVHKRLDGFAAKPKHISSGKERSVDLIQLCFSLACQIEKFLHVMVIGIAYHMNIWFNRMVWIRKKDAQIFILHELLKDCSYALRVTQQRLHHISPPPSQFPCVMWGSFRVNMQHHFMLNKFSPQRYQHRKNISATVLSDTNI